MHGFIWPIFWLVVAIGIGVCFAEPIDLVWWGSAIVLAGLAGCPTLTGDA